MVKFFRFSFWLVATLAGLAWTIVTLFLRLGAEADRDRPDPGLGAYRDWDGTVRPYTYDSDGNPTPGQRTF
jgi:hypothetical protein